MQGQRWNLGISQGTGGNYPSNYVPGFRSTDQVSTLVKNLTSTSLSERSDALHSLSSQREAITDLAVLLWDAPATITALLSEVLSVYSHLAASSPTSNTAPPSLNARLANRVCNVLALFQCVACHDLTRGPFIQANIPIYLFPFLHTTNKSRECEFFKIASLGVIGNLVKPAQPDIIEYLLQNEFVPLCLRILKFGQEISRTVAAYIVQRILSDPSGRQHVCSNRQRLDTVIKVLNLVLYDLAGNFSKNLSKNVLLSYEYLLTVDHGREAAAHSDIEKLKTIQLGKCDDAFVQLVNRLKEMNMVGNRHAQQDTF